LFCVIILSRPAMGPVTFIATRAKLFFRIPTIIALRTRFSEWMQKMNYRRFVSLARVIRSAHANSPSAFYFPHESLEQRQRRISDHYYGRYLNEKVDSFRFLARLCGLCPLKAAQTFGIKHII
jgi:hypothetical protein